MSMGFMKKELYDVTGGQDITPATLRLPILRLLILRLVKLPILFLSLLAVPIVSLAQPPVAIHISGDLTESQRQNIQSHLSLARLADDEIPSEALFNRLYGKVRQEVAKALEPFGYYSPGIGLRHEEHEDGTYLVELVITTGEPITIKEVNIALSGSGEGDKTLQEAIRYFPLHENEVLDHQLYEGGKDKLIAVALERGYLRASFHKSRVNINKKSLNADIHLRLDTGPRYFFGPISFDADWIDHDLLRKIAAIQEGDPFSPKALTRLRQVLFNADYFATVDLAYDLTQAVSYKVPVKVILTPNLSHKYGVGLGYGTDTGLRAALEYTNRHVNSLGHQFSMQLQPSQRKDNLSGTYTIPMGDPRKERLSITGKYATEQFASTDMTTLSGTVSHDQFREWGEYSTLLQFLDERYNTGSKEAEDALVIPGLKGSVFWADDRITTKRGIRLTGTVIGSEENVLANSTFLQSSLRGKAIYSLFDWRCIGRGEIGTTLVNDIQSLPPSLRYYAGGDQSVRGYGYKKLGPLDASGNVIGGKNLLTYSVEMEHSLFEQWSGALFYDSGTATNSFTNIALHSGVGVGVRWSSLFGQIRFDVAKALDENGGWRIHFSMGADL